MWLALMTTLLTSAALPRSRLTVRNSSASDTGVTLLASAAGQFWVLHRGFRARAAVLRSGRNRALELLDRGADRVELVLEPLDVLVALLGLRTRPVCRVVFGLDGEVARPQLATAVALLGDVATEQLAGLDVDRMVGEELVENVRPGLAAVL